MAFAVPKELYSGKICTVDIGTGDKAVKIGGENCLPFLTFEGDIPNKPPIAIEITDIPPTNWPEIVATEYKQVGDNPVTWAKYCQDELQADILVLRLIGTHPEMGDINPKEAAKTVEAVCNVIDIPLIILGSNHVGKDTEIMNDVAIAAKGKNCVIGKAQEDNYKTIVAAAQSNDHKIVAMSDLDINLAKQLNILITQMGFDINKIIVDPMCSALGYGFEYTYSVMERIKQAALMQNDPMMQAPLMADVGMYVWKIKETYALEEAEPAWGSLKERAIAWEITTAVGLLVAGADMLIMRHPKAISIVKDLINELS